MIRGNKRINPNSRREIDVLKSNMRFSSSPFDGVGYPFKTAVKELRAEGVNIIYDGNNCRYYNPDTVSNIWGY